VAFVGRLIFCLLVFACCRAGAFGVAPKTKGYQWTCQISTAGTGKPGTGTSAVSACRGVPLASPREFSGPGNDWLVTYSAINPDTKCLSLAPLNLTCGGTVHKSYSANTGSGQCDPALGYGDCSRTPPDSDVPISFQASGVESVVCPSNSNAVQGGKACECMDGFKLQGAQCVPYDCPIGGAYSVYTQTDMQVNAAGDTVCSAGCVYKPSVYRQGKDGRVWGGWPFVASGGTCTGDRDSTGVSSGSANEKNPAPTPCAQGMCPGSASMNGSSVNVCVPCSSTIEPPKTSTTETPSMGASSPDGSNSSKTTTKEQTSCDGVTCTTTRTTTDDKGNVRQTQTDQKPQQTFCQENPQATICKDSKWGGSCAQTQCNGDAVQCAIAQEQYRRNCQLFDDTGMKKYQDLANQAAGAGLRPSDHPNNDKNVVDMGDFSKSVDTSDSLGASASCPADYGFVFMGTETVLSFSSVCDQARILGNLGVAVCWLVCGLIVFRPSSGG